MPDTPKTPKLEANETDPNQITGRPTQSNGIREARLEADPADPTRKVHPDSVPLMGATQPSRNDSIMPDAEPTVPDIDRPKVPDGPAPV